MTTVQIDRKVILWGAIYGLCEWRDGGWATTDLGNQVIRDYLARLEGEE